MYINNDTPKKDFFKKVNCHMPLNGKKIVEINQSIFDLGVESY